MANKFYILPVANAKELKKEGHTIALDKSVGVRAEIVMNDNNEPVIKDTLQKIVVGVPQLDCDYLLNQKEYKELITTGVLHSEKGGLSYTFEYDKTTNEINGYVDLSNYTVVMR